MPISEHFTTALEAITAIANAYFYAGKLDDAVNILRQGLELIGYDEVPQAAHFDFLLSYGAMLSQEAWLAESDYEPAKQIVVQLGAMAENPSQQGRLLNLQGNILRQQAMSAANGDFITPRKLFEESLSLLDAQNLPQAYFWSLFHMGLCDQFLADYDSAMAIFREAETIAREYDFQHEISYVIRHIGFVYQFIGKLEEALTALQESLALREKIGFGIFLGLSYVAVAGVLHQSGKQDEAKAHFELAIQHCDAVGFMRSMMITRVNYGQALFEYGELEAAQPYLQQAKAYAKQLQHAGALQLAEDLLVKISEAS